MSGLAIMRQWLREEPAVIAARSLPSPLARPLACHIDVASSSARRSVPFSQAPGPGHLSRCWRAAGRRSFHPQAVEHARHAKKRGWAGAHPHYFSSIYFAYSTVRFSLITVIFICPGYSNSSSICLAISRDNDTHPRSSMASDFTITRISLPACRA